LNRFSPIDDTPGEISFQDFCCRPKGWLDVVLHGVDEIRPARKESMTMLLNVVFSIFQVLPADVKFLRGVRIDFHLIAGLKSADGQQTMRVFYCTFNILLCKQRTNRHVWVIFPKRLIMVYKSTLWQVPMSPRTSCKWATANSVNF
jgi:hypothetical protein